MSELVRITDVSPRDGLQNEPGIIPTAEKVRLIELLCATGVDEIEVTSFVSPKWVPQLADAGELLARFASCSPSQREGVGGWAEELPVGRWTPPARQAITHSRAQMLRTQTTGSETAMWELLRDRRMMGVKFRRQHPFGPYVLDFFCQEKLLAVEIDGDSHVGAEAKTADQVRTDWITSRGVDVIRFSNLAVQSDAGGVAARIRQVLESRPALGTARPTAADGAAVGGPPPTPQPPPSGRGGRRRPTAISVLVPNERGLQGVLDANRSVQRRLISKVSVFSAASETFSIKNTNANIAETLERFGPVIRSASAEGLQTRGYISCAIACPFEGPVDPSRVVEVASRLIDLGVTEIDLGDTIGAGTPETTCALLETYAKRWPIRGARVPLTLHLHDTFGRAADCVRAALDLGVRSFDGSVAGLGGCPYATKKLPDGTIQRAPGNISTETLVKTIHAAGYETGVDLDALERAAEYARAMVAKSRASAAVAGKPDAGGAS